MVSSGPRSYCCHECRRRKVKCDGQKPACQRCTKRGKTCTGFPSSFKFLDHQTSCGSQLQFSQSEPNTPTQLRAGFATPETQDSQPVKKRQTPAKNCQRKNCSFKEFTPKSHAGVSTKKKPDPQEDLPSHGSPSSYHADQHQSQETQSQIHSTPSMQSDRFLQFSAIPTDYTCHSGITQTDTVPTQRSTFSSPQAESLNPTSDFPECSNRGYCMMSGTNSETNPNESHTQSPTDYCTQDFPNFQLVSSPEFMADEELEAYWEVLNAEYMAGCQGYHESGSASYPSSIDGTSYFENRIQHCGIQNEDAGSNSAMDRASACCGDSGALSSRELYLCNFFL